MKLIHCYLCTPQGYKIPPQQLDTYHLKYKKQVNSWHLGVQSRNLPCPRGLWSFLELQHISRQQHDLPCCHHSTPASWKAGDPRALLQKPTRNTHIPDPERADRNKPQRDSIFLSSLLSGDILLVSQGSSNSCYKLRGMETGMVESPIPDPTQGLF